MRTILFVFVALSVVIVIDGCFSWQTKCGSDCCSSTESCYSGKCVKDKVDCGWSSCPMSHPTCCGIYCCPNATTCCSIYCCRTGYECCKSKCVYAGTCPTTTRRTTPTPSRTTWRWYTSVRPVYTTRYTINPTTGWFYTTRWPTKGFTSKSSSSVVVIAVGITIPVFFIAIVLVLCIMCCRRQKPTQGRTLATATATAPPIEQRMVVTYPNRAQVSNNVTSQNDTANHIFATNNMTSTPYSVPNFSAEPPSYESVVQSNKLAAEGDRPPPYAPNPLYASPVQQTIISGGNSSSDANYSTVSANDSAITSGASQA